MGREIKLVHITAEYFVCGICNNFVKETVECRICERLFCSECLIQYVENNNQDCICPNGCIDPVFEKAGSAFEKILESVFAKCKNFQCSKLESLKDLENHEKNCAVKRKNFDFSQDTLTKRDLLWIDVINKVMTPKGNTMQNFGLIDGSFASTPKIQNYFKF